MSRFCEEAGIFLGRYLAPTEQSVRFVYDQIALAEAVITADSSGVSQDFAFTVGISVDNSNGAEEFAYDNGEASPDGAAPVSETFTVTNT